jgi:N-acetylglucosamine kinase-like BadF-type ATPase
MVKNKVKYQPSNLLCGIDGGGTTTKVVVCNREGEIICSFRTGTINHYGAGTEKAAENFSCIAARLNEELGCIPGFIFTGNSALDGLASEERVNELTRGVFGKSKVIFHSDVYVALLGFTKGEAGAVLISGTGSMACGIDEKGKYQSVGGWGQVLGDEGSGYHMALEGIKAGLRAYDGISEQTLLTDSIMNFFNLKNMADLIDKIYNRTVEKSLIADFATEVEKAAENGDYVALSILNEEAQWLYKLSLAITGKCNTKNLGYSGSVLQQNKTVLAELTKLLGKNNIKLQAPLFSPEIGAIFGAFREAGINITSSLTNNLLKYR